MKKLIPLLLLSLLFFSGCSLLPRIQFGSPGTVPQQTERGKERIICRGELIQHRDGTYTCTEGFQYYSEFFERKERRMTLVERIKGFINNLVGWGFWIFVALLFLCPSLIGLIFGRLLEATIGITGKSLRAVVRGVQRTRVQGEDLNNALDKEEDSDVKKYIRKLKEKEKIK